MADMGRTKIKVDYKIVEAMAKVMATQEDIATQLGCSTKTLQRDEYFCRIYKEGLATARTSLRRKQFILAETNASCAIWLGKQYLDQHDKSEVINTNIDLKLDKTARKARILELEQKRKPLL